MSSTDQLYDGPQRDSSKRVLPLYIRQSIDPTFIPPIFNLQSRNPRIQSQEMSPRKIPQSAVFSPANPNASAQNQTPNEQLKADPQLNSPADSSIIQNIDETNQQQDVKTPSKETKKQKTPSKKERSNKTPVSSNISQFQSPQLSSQSPLSPTQQADLNSIVSKDQMELRELEWMEIEAELADGEEVPVQFPVLSQILKISNVNCNEDVNQMDKRNIQQYQSNSDNESLNNDSNKTDKQAKSNRKDKDKMSKYQQDPENVCLEPLNSVQEEEEITRIREQQDSEYQQYFNDNNLNTRSQHSESTKARAIARRAKRKIDWEEQQEIEKQQQEEMKIFKQEQWKLYKTFTLSDDDADIAEDDITQLDKNILQITKLKDNDNKQQQQKDDDDLFEEDPLDLAIDDVHDCLEIEATAKQN
ncbi:MAG: hypothetical protein EZS28_002548 [Streblomastix strix]|uniref:Uncharacterized protein n=1 Tax=Streblomastix strix TaxID=222440 RepID=A0A5J4X4L3_9EUKA|nr:MAG: hypothetical protein EZS28_002548 [Streblomastix strix]